MFTEQKLRLSVTRAHLENCLRDRTAAQWVMSARDHARRTVMEPSLRRAYERRAKRHNPNLPSLTADVRAMLEAVETEGVHVCPLASLNIPRTDEILQTARTLIPKLAQGHATRHGSYTVQTDEAFFKAFPELFLWGLDDNVLDMVENYLGVPVGYNGIKINRSIANNVGNSTRMWHLDPQDHRMFRIIVYLSDTDNDDGPYEYISRQWTEKLRRLLNYSNEHIPDPIMRRAAPADQWKSCVGPRGTAVLTDTCSVFHRGKVPKDRERYAIFYTYYSATPMHERYLQPGFSPEYLASIDDKLTERQRASLLWRS